MRILHVIPTLAPRYGGPVTVLKELAKHQVEAGEEVMIYTTTLDYPRGQLRAPGEELESSSGVRVRYFASELPKYVFSWAMAKALRREIVNFDVVHIWTIYRFPSAYACHIARKHGVPHVVRPCGALEPPIRRQSAVNLPLKRLYEWLVEWRNLKRATAVNCVTETEARNLPNFIEKERVFTLHNGADWARYSVLPRRGGFRARIGIGEAPLVLFLGRINFKKGLDLLIPAFASVQKAVPEARLAIVGPDNEGYSRQVRRWVEERGLTRQVYFVGHLNGDDVLQAYVDADVFVLPSYTENFGVSVVEAMGSGTPVVVSENVNIHDRVSAHGAGLVVPCKWADIASSLVELLRQDDVRLAMGQAGRRAVQQEFSWPRVVDKLTKEYQRLLKGYGQKGHGGTLGSSE